MTDLALLGGEKAVPDGTIKPWPPVDDTDREMVMASLNGGDHACGPSCEAFQDEYAEWNGNKHAIFTNSGTAALHMALVACGVGAGDHVLVPSYSWSSSATCVIHANAIPVFVDINFDTVTMDEELIEATITPRTKAIIVVHLHGLMGNMRKIMDIAEKHGLKVIEDACQAHGARFEGRKAGTWGHCAAFSFNQNKCLCSGEGGMFVTDDEEMRQLAAQVWSFGETRTPHESRDYHAYALGWMYRGSDLVAAFGRSQLKKLDGYLQTQQDNAAVLNKGLAGIKGLILPTEPEGHFHNWYNYMPRIDMAEIGCDGDPSAMRDAVMKALNAEGVPAGVYQTFPLPSMTVFQAKNAYGGGCPWSCKGAGDGVTYEATDYPAAQRHTETHFGMTEPLRAPNGTEVAQKVAEGIRKVFANLDRIDPANING